MQGAPAFRREPALAPGRRPAAGSRLLAAPLKSPSYARLLAFLPRHRPLVDPLHRPWEMVMWKRKRKRRESRRTKAVGDGADELRRRWLDGERGEREEGDRALASPASHRRRYPRPDPASPGRIWPPRHHSDSDDPAAESTGGGRGDLAIDVVGHPTRPSSSATPRICRRRPHHAALAIDRERERSEEETVGVGDEKMRKRRGRGVAGLRGMGGIFVLGYLGPGHLL